jgi:hypothetical protein
MRVSSTAVVVCLLHAPIALAGPGSGARGPETAPSTSSAATSAAAYIPPPPPGPVRARVSVVGEAVRDEAIARVYGGSSLAGEIALGAGLPFGLEASVSVGYRRLGGTALTEEGVQAAGASTWLWYAPVSLTAGYGYDMGVVEAFAAVGPSYVVWAEQPGTQPDVGYSGGKMGLLLEAGARVPLGRPLTDIRYEPPSPSTVELVLTTGWRASFLRSGDECPGESPCGLDFSALRLGAGVGARF